MKKELLLVIVLAMSGTGCLPYATKRTPEVPHPRRLPEVEGSPSIRLVVRDHTDQAQTVARAVERWKQKMPYLAEASNDITEPDYTIELSVRYAEENEGVGLSAMTFLLLPCFGWEQVQVRATVTDSEKAEVGVFHSSQKNRYVVQMHLLYLTPFTLPMAIVNEKQLWNCTIRDALLQAGRAVAADRASREVGHEDA